MFTEGEAVKVSGLKEEIKMVLLEALNVQHFKDITFYFIEYENDIYATLSAETDKMFAVVHCPIIALDTNNDTSQEIDDLFNYLLIDYALKTRDKDLFMKLTSPEDDGENELEIQDVFEEDEV